MNEDQVKSAVRWVLTALGGVLVSKGVIDASSEPTAITLAVDCFGGVFALGSFAWSQWHHAGPNKADAVAVITGNATAAQQVAVAKATS